MQKWLEQTGFLNLVDSAGKFESALEYTQFHRPRLLDGEEWIRGPQEFRLVNGDQLKQLDAWTFEVVRSGKRLRLT